MNPRFIPVFSAALVLAIHSIIAANGPSIDSLLSQLYSGQIKEDIGKYELLYKIADNSDDADTIIKYSDEAIRLAEQLNISPAEALVLKGTGYLNSSKPTSALECFIEAAGYYSEDNNNIDLARTYSYMAEAYSQIGNHDNEQRYLKDAIDIFRQQNDSINAVRLAGTLNNLGFAKYSIGQCDTALILFSEASETYMKLGDMKKYAYCLGNSGLVYSKLSEFEQAEVYLLLAIEMLNQEGDNFAVPQFMTEYAGILQQKGEIEKAINYANGSFNIARENGLIERERDAAFRLAQLYQLSGSIDSAFRYQSLYITASDSINSNSGAENIQKMADMRTEFELAIVQARVDALQREGTIKLIVIGGLVLILLLAAGLIMLYYYSLKRSKELTASLEERRTLLEKQEEDLQEVNRLLEEQKEELMQQKEELQSTLDNLKKTQEQLVESEKMAATCGLVAGVAHEMNTPIGVGVTAVSNLLDDVQKMSELYEKDDVSREDFKEFLQTTNSVSKLIQKNLERAASLIQSFKQISTDQVTEQQRIFVFREYLNDILLSFEPKFRGKKIEFRIECDHKMKLNSYPGVYAQIFTNLLSNSLQHGYSEKNKGIITIKADKDSEILNIQYSDDGAGIDRKDLHHVFEPFYTSDQHRGTGLGLNVIYNLVKQKLHGTIACESEQGYGVLFTIKVPVK